MKTSIGFANCSDSYSCGMQCAEQVLRDGGLHHPYAYDNSWGDCDF